MLFCYHVYHVPKIQEVVTGQLNSLLYMRQKFTPNACLQFCSLFKYLHKHDQ